MIGDGKRLTVACRIGWIYTMKWEHIFVIKTLKNIVNLLEFTYLTWNGLYDNIGCRRYKRRCYNIRREHGLLRRNRRKLIEVGHTKRWNIWRCSKYLLWYIIKHDNWTSFKYQMYIFTGASITADEKVRTIACGGDCILILNK